MQSGWLATRLEALGGNLFFRSSTTTAAFGSSSSSSVAASVENSSASSCTLYRLEPHIDYVGGDISRDPMPAVDQEACCTACEQSRFCNAFTYVASSRDCWLKRRRLRPTPQRVHWAGLRRGHPEVQAHWHPATACHKEADALWGAAVCEIGLLAVELRHWRF